MGALFVLFEILALFTQKSIAMLTFMVLVKCYELKLLLRSILTHSVNKIKFDVLTELLT